MILRELLFKCAFNAYADWLWLLNPYVRLGPKLWYYPRKYWAIARNRRHIWYMGNVFRYDNRFMPFLLQLHGAEMVRLNRAVPLDRITTVLDIGANCGQWTVTLSRAYPHVRVWCFEPHDNASKLLLNNAPQQVQMPIHCCAIGPRQEWVKLSFRAEKSGEATLLRGTDSLQTQSAWMRPLDAEILDCAGIPPVMDLVKIDVEGYEREVLQSISGVHWRYLYVEVGHKRAGAMTTGEVMSVASRARGEPVRLLSEGIKWPWSTCRPIVLTCEPREA